MDIACAYGERIGCLLLMSLGRDDPRVASNVLRNCQDGYQGKYSSTLSGVLKGLSEMPFRDP